MRFFSMLFVVVLLCSNVSASVILDGGPDRWWIAKPTIVIEEEVNEMKAKRLHDKRLRNRKRLSELKAALSAEDRKLIQAMEHATKDFQERSEEYRERLKLKRELEKRSRVPTGSEKL